MKEYKCPECGLYMTEVQWEYFCNESCPRCNSALLKDFWSRKVAEVNEITLDNDEET